MPKIVLFPPDFKSLLAGFEALTDSVQRKVMRQSVHAGASAVKKEIRKRTPMSAKTGTRDLWSARTKARRAHSDKKWPLKQSLVIKPSSKWKKARVLASQGIIGSTVGHDYSIGPHAHLVDDGHELYAWSDSPSGLWVAGTDYFRDGQEASLHDAKSKMESKARASFEKEVERAFKKAQKKAAKHG